MDPSEGELQELGGWWGADGARVSHGAGDESAAENGGPATARFAPLRRRSIALQTSAPHAAPLGQSGRPSTCAATNLDNQASAPDLESRIGSHWLNRIGISAVLIGVSYFLKFAFDNNWIGPAGRVAIGLLAGIAIVVWSETFSPPRLSRVFIFVEGRRHRHSLSLALCGFPGLQPDSQQRGFLMMLAVTAATAVMAWTQDAEILAAFALIGGFTTPLLLSTGENREVALFAYVAILDLGALALVILKPWRRLLVLSYAGTLLLYIGWYSSFYDQHTTSHDRGLRDPILRDLRGSALVGASGEKRGVAVRVASRHSGRGERRRIFPPDLRNV